MSDPQQYPPYSPEPYPPQQPVPGYGAPPPGYGPPPPAIPYAHWGLRVLAAFLDSLLLVPFYLVIAFVGGGLITSDATTGPDGTLVLSDPGGNTLAGVLVFIAGGLAMFAFALWNQVIRQGRRGASLGKQWVGIRVVAEEDGRPIGAAMTFVRHLVHILDALPLYVGYLWPLWDPKRQTFADKIMKTAVLHLPPSSLS